MASQSYASAWRQYQEAIDSLHRKDVTATTERGGGITAAVDTAKVDQVLQRSQELRSALTSAADTADPEVRDLAGLKLLAGAAYDLALAEDLAAAADAGTAGVERSASAVFASPELRAVLDVPLQPGAFATLLAVERAALPTELAPARDNLREMVLDFLKDAPEKAADTATSAIAGAVDFGLGPLQVGLTAATQQIMDHLPQNLSWLLRKAAELAQEAVRKIWEAFGAAQQDKIKDEAQGWFKQLLEKPNYAAALLELLYDTKGLEKEVGALIDDPSSTDYRPFNTAAQALEELRGRYAKIMKVQGWVLTGAGWLKGWLLAIPPWGPVAAYAVYGGVLGYSIYAGGDYLDAHRFDGKWLDHVRGMRAVLQEALGQKQMA